MQKVKLQTLCYPDQIGKYGIPASAEEYSNTKIRYLRISDIDDTGNLLNNDKKSVSDKDIEKYILKAGDIVFARTGNSTGRTYFHEEKNGKLAFAGFLIKYGLDESKVNPKYLKYFTVSQEYKQWVKNLSVGSTRGNINAQTFADCPIILPKRLQQDYLVKVLSALDSKIEINNKINTELEAMAKMIYDYWFVQFDFPDKNGKPYKASGGKMVWNEKLRREIPEGWEIHKIGDILETSLGGTPSTEKKDFWDNGAFNWLNSGEVASFPVVNSELKVTKEAINNSATELLPKGTTLLSITRHLRPSILGIDACVNQSVVGIKERGEITCYYLYPYIKNEIPRLLKIRTGAQQPHINKEAIDDSLIKIPDKGSIIFKEYNSLVGSMYKMIINNALQNQKLLEFRDWLLPMLMNGQVKVKDTERF